MRHSLHLRSLLAIGVSTAALLGAAAPALAQDAPAADDGTTVADVIVTAQKKEEALQDVPIAVSAFSQQSLEKQKIDGGPNLVTAIPNVNFSKGNFTGYNFQIRGVGSKLVAGSGDAGTGIHLNNAPLTANNLFESEFFDVERVEVLRGPQGTLYGRNATGGVVNIITAKPVMNDFSALAKVEYGNYNSLKLKGMINVPIGDDLALRVAAVSLTRDGYGKNLITKHDIDDRSLWDVRATLAWQPSDSFKASLMYDHFDEDDSRSRIGRQFCDKDTGPTSVGGVGLFPVGVIASVERGFLSQGCKNTSLYAPGVSTGTLNSQATLGGLFGALTGLQTGDAYAGQSQTKNIRDIQSVSDPIYQSSTDIYEFNIDWDLTDDLKLTSLTSYSTLNLFTRTDYTRVVPNSTFNVAPNPVNAIASAVQAGVCASLLQARNCPAGAGVYNGIYAGLFPGGVVNDPQVGAQNRFTTFDISSADTKQFTQELRLQSDFDGPINFNVGGIYLDYKATGDYYVMFNTGTAFVGVNNFLNTGSVNCAAATPGCTFIDPNSNPNRSGHNYYDSYGPYHLKSRAAFGEVYWKLTDTFKITGGLRYTDDSKSVENHAVTLNTPGGGVGAPPTGQPPLLKVRFQEFTGRLGFDWKLTDDSLLYAFYSKGYKAGGVNPACSATVGCPPASFAPEFVNSFEIGSKNTFLDGSLLLNVTGFYYDYKGYQVSKIVNRTSINENIDAKIKGLEIETIWNPVRNLRLNANIGYLDTEIVNGSSIDTLNRTQDNPALTLVKSSSASNCVVSTAALSNFMSIFNAQTPVIPVAGDALNPPSVRPLNVFDFLGICSGSFAAFGLNPTDGVAVSLKGKELPNSPPWTASFGAQYTWDFGDWSTTLRGDYYKQADSFARIYNSDADKIKGWQNLNFTLTVANPGAGLIIDAFVKNATDEEAITDTYLTDDSSGLYRNAFYSEPRTYGVAISKRF
ncbi:outer membrane receptor protein involved in Fe transport [Caulobacter ginsengisoli]|uniref:Outer membrane receptor protein involved in Fe transport n=1 Tax=Caulobacter ginsengisoli TaxID=400775 RepID=A0ABU0IYB3_9CAUL|nr:TonB-dependent receptor [Caulobacter ginsengisoli]MDQ0466999.1 outer membrane receptor protein involved in Fe transport [Caulobacter ginsengisoli]